MPSSVSAQQSRLLVGQLRRSQVVRDYERAFRDTTGLPIALRPIESFDLPHRGDPKESPFCALVTRSNRSCAACLQFQRSVETRARLRPRSLRCFAGLCDSAVPVRVGENLIAFLQTGQVLVDRPSPARFRRAARQLVKWGAEIDQRQLEAAYFQTRVVTRKQYEAMLRLLTIFAQHLSTLSNQLMVQTSAAEAPAIARARTLIAERHSEELTLTSVAQSVNMSAFYFCKMFKKATGMTFTDYLARVRIEKVKNLLLNPHLRASEAAYEVGFQSLSQFNRVFRRIVGESTSSYRDRVRTGSTGQSGDVAAG